MIKAILLLLTLLLVGCINHEVDTFPEWCEQISGIDLESKYGKPWAPIFSVSFKSDKIRDDFTAFLNNSYVEKAEKRASKIVWREETILNIMNLSALFVIEPDAFISEWRHGVETAKTFSHTDPVDKCLYGTVTSLFDTVKIHTYELDSLGNIISDEVTIVNTDRKSRLKNPI